MIDFFIEELMVRAQRMGVSIRAADRFLDAAPGWCSYQLITAAFPVLLLNGILLSNELLYRYVAFPK